MITISLKTCYKTVAQEGEALLVEKKSKFIATVRPVATEDEAIAFIGEMRSKYSDARHNVYAYVIDENNIFRYSDDGEPQGTAGMPVLDVIRRAGLVDTAVVVTRYFGGTLLGTGGLVHAYGTSAGMGLENAKIITRALCDIVSVHTDYTLAGKIQHLAAMRNYTVVDTIYDSAVTFLIRSRIEDTDSLIAEITDLTNARAVCERVERKYADLD